MKKILFVGSEALPFAATGGLADVLGSLPAALMREDPELDVRVVIPMYQVVSEKYKEKSRLVSEFTVQLAWRRQYCGVWEYRLGNVTYYFIDNEYYFKRPSLYGSYDDGERYAYFCKAVMEMMPHIDFFPDILHCHDWQERAVRHIPLPQVQVSRGLLEDEVGLHDSQYRLSGNIQL